MHWNTERQEQNDVINSQAYEIANLKKELDRYKFKYKSWQAEKENFLNQNKLYERRINDLQLEVLSLKQSQRSNSTQSVLSPKVSSSRNLSGNTDRSDLKSQSASAVIPTSKRNLSVKIPEEPNIQLSSHLITPNTDGSNLPSSLLQTKVPGLDEPLVSTRAESPDPSEISVSSFNTAATSQPHNAQGLQQFSGIRNTRFNSELQNKKVAHNRNASYASGKPGTEDGFMTAQTSASQASPVLPVTNITQNHSQRSSSQKITSRSKTEHNLRNESLDSKMSRISSLKNASTTGRMSPIADSRNKRSSREDLLSDEHDNARPLPTLAAKLLFGVNNKTGGTSSDHDSATLRDKNNKSKTPTSGHYREIRHESSHQNQQRTAERNAMRGQSKLIIDHSTKSQGQMSGIGEDNERTHSALGNLNSMKPPGSLGTIRASGNSSQQDHYSRPSSALQLSNSRRPESRKTPTERQYHDMIEPDSAEPRSRNTSLPQKVHRENLENPVAVTKSLGTTAVMQANIQKQTSLRTKANATPPQLKGHPRIKQLSGQSSSALANRNSSSSPTSRNLTNISKSRSLTRLRAELKANELDGETTCDEDMQTPSQTRRSFGFRQHGPPVAKNPLLPKYNPVQTNQLANQNKSLAKSTHNIYNDLRGSLSQETVTRATSSGNMLNEPDQKQVSSKPLSIVGKLQNKLNSTNPVLDKNRPRTKSPFNRSAEAHSSIKPIMKKAGLTGAETNPAVKSSPQISGPNLVRPSSRANSTTNNNSHQFIGVTTKTSKISSLTEQKQQTTTLIESNKPAYTVSRRKTQHMESKEDRLEKTKSLNIEELKRDFKVDETNAAHMSLGISLKDRQKMLRQQFEKDQSPERQMIAKRTQSGNRGDSQNRSKTPSKFFNQIEQLNTVVVFYLIGQFVFQLKNI